MEQLSTQHDLAKELLAVFGIDTAKEKVRAFTLDFDAAKAPVLTVQIFPSGRQLNKAAKIVAAHADEITVRVRDDYDPEADQAAFAEWLDRNKDIIRRAP
jgi:hypothetical protein